MMPFQYTGWYTSPTHASAEDSIISGPMRYS